MDMAVIDLRTERWDDTLYEARPVDPQQPWNTNPPTEWHHARPALLKEPIRPERTRDSLVYLISNRSEWKGENTEGRNDP